MLTDLVSGESLLSESRTAVFLLRPHMTEVKELPGASFIRTRVPVLGLTLMS